MDIIKSCIRETNGSYTLEITITVNDTSIGPVIIPITKEQATVLEKAGVPNCA